MDMLKTISHAFKVAEIRSKMIFTLLMLVVFRIGSNIPVPGIDRATLSQVFTGETGLFDLFDLFSGGSFSQFTIFALSITPYITASIIIQLLTIAFPYFERLAKEGEEGRKKMAQITRYLTIVLALVQAGSYERVVLQPLMIVAGDHANNDMAGNEEGSWKTTFEAAGYQVECLVNGLGELEAVQNLLVAHAQAAIDALN